MSSRNNETTARNQLNQQNEGSLLEKKTCGVYLVFSTLTTESMDNERIYFLCFNCVISFKWLSLLIKRTNRKQINTNLDAVMNFKSGRKWSVWIINKSNEMIMKNKIKLRTFFYNYDFAIVQRHWRTRLRGGGGWKSCFSMKKRGETVKYIF